MQEPLYAPRLVGTRPRQVLLLRHGETDANAKAVVQGHSPTPLNPLGHEQARLLAARLVNWQPRIDALITSDLPRALQTAEPIAAACGLAPTCDAAWRERGLGEFEGQAVGELELWRLASGENTPPGAESVAEFQDRIRTALLALSRPGDGTIAVVTHGGPIRSILRMLGDGRLTLAGAMPCEEPAAIPNCSILGLEQAAAQWRVIACNDVSHLGAVPAGTDAG
jgi:probable phosphoglycerate mutase